ncbi:hypothetical protein RASY3_14490 [Ruminococcus albus SY3]|uniref:HTH cro/C1-type domain-containing protein n=1 Tax=Ruminococcus albus SY3 TaxID=1341156 RepID=A0A011UWT0_RUMAL|nr:helix-turn-helix domain-containing protein [Ruminococcus albus]EXM37647.1 hypothetical protein RASY3_14490 [Ruminococcus albus SY3]
MNFSDKLIRLRKAFGYTKKYVAESVGVSCTAIAAYEDGKTAPQYKIIYKGIANLFGVPLEFLMVEKPHDEVVLASITKRQTRLRINAISCDIDRICAEIRGLRKIERLTAEDALKIIGAVTGNE